MFQNFQNSIMGCTTLKFKKTPEELAEDSTYDCHVLVFISVQEPDGLNIDIHQGDPETLLPLGKIKELWRTGMIDEQYHRELRIPTIEKGQFIQARSTNPEWSEPKKN